MLVEAELLALEERLTQLASGFVDEHIGVMLPAEVSAPAMVAEVFPWGGWADPELMARDLYAGLRALDGQGCTVILCPLPPQDGIGAAICDRLRKAGK